MEEKKEKLVLDGNAFYELDLECVRKKAEKKRQAPGDHKKKGQRN